MSFYPQNYRRLHLYPTFVTANVFVQKATPISEGSFHCLPKLSTFDKVSQATQTLRLSAVAVKAQKAQCPIRA